MTSPPDPTEFAHLMRERIQRIKENPKETLFSDFEGTSQDGKVTAWVDMMGRLQRLTIASEYCAPGDENSVAQAVLNANRAAQHAANHLDFDRAAFARELGDALNQKEAPQTSDQQSGQAGRKSSPEDDEFDDSTGSWLR